MSLKFREVHMIDMHEKFNASWNTANCVGLFVLNALAWLAKFLLDLNIIYPVIITCLLVALFFVILYYIPIYSWKRVRAIESERRRELS